MECDYDMHGYDAAVLLFSFINLHSSTNFGALSNCGDFCFFACVKILELVNSLLYVYLFRHCFDMYTQIPWERSCFIQNKIKKILNDETWKNRSQKTYNTFARVLLLKTINHLVSYTSM